MNITICSSDVHYTVPQISLLSFYSVGLTYRVRAGDTQVWEQQELIGLAYRVRTGDTQV